MGIGDYSATDYLNTVLPGDPVIDISNSELRLPENVIHRKVLQRLMADLKSDFTDRGMTTINAFNPTGDGVADDTVALQAAADSGASGLMFGEGKNYKITDTVTFPANQDLDFQSSTITYAGIRNRPAIVHGSVDTKNTAELRNVKIASATLDWGDINYVGIRVFNLLRSKVHIRSISSFTTGYELRSNGQGYAHVYHHLASILDCKHGLLATSDTAVSYINENTFIGGDITNTSSSDSLGDCYGIHFRAINSGYEFPNGNKFYGPCFQPGDGQSGDERIPIYFEDVGQQNAFYDIRHEGGRGVTMRCDGPVGDGTSADAVVTQNTVTILVSAGSNITLAVDQNDSARLNIVRYSSRPNDDANSYFINDVYKKVKAYSATEYVALGEFAFGSSASASISHSIAATTDEIAILEDSVLIEGPRALGFYVDTDGDESFIINLTAKSGYEGRIGVVAFDSDGARLTNLSSGHPNVVMGTSTAYNYWSSTYGGCFIIQNDNSETMFSVSSSVKKLWVFFTGGTNPARIIAVGITRLSPSAKPLHVYSGQDASPDIHYATVDPDGGRGGVYHRGDIAVNVNAATGVLPDWRCVTSGRLAPPWAASTAYTVDELVFNDTDKIYKCVTAGTSAGSGGPTGTGTGISDNTVTWDYLSAEAAFIASPSLP